MPSMAGEMAFAPNDLRQQIEGSPQQTEMLRRQAEQVGPEAASMAGMTAGMLVPPIRAAQAAPFLLRAAATIGTGATGGGVQMGVEEAAKQALGASELSASKIAKQTGIGAVGGALLAPVAAGLLAGGERVVGAAKEFLTLGPDVAKRVATTLWPSVRKPLKEAQELAAEARDTIQRHTGIEVPIGVSEAVGHPETARRLANSGKLGSEYSEAEQDAVKRMVAMAAADLRGANPSPNELGDRAVKLLEAEIGRISAPAKAAVQKTADELHPAMTRAFDEIQNTARQLIPGTAASPTMAGQAMRQSIQEGLHGLTAEEQAAYAQASKMAPPNAVPVMIPELKTTTAKLNFETPRTEPTGPSSGGNPIPSLIPNESRKYVSEIAGATDEWTLKQALRVRSEIGRAMGDSELLPGIGRHDLGEMYAALTKDIESSLAPAPLGAWRKAWGLTKAKSDQFNFRLVGDIVDEFGREGGTGPAAIASKMTTQDAPKIIEAMEKAAGKQNAPALHQAIGEYLFNHVGDASKNARTGEISVDTLLNGITKLAPEVQARYFPGAAAVAKLANREAALAGLTKATKGQAAKEVVAALEVTDPALLAEALGSKPSADVMQKLQLALSENARESAAYRGTVLGRLKAGNADGITDSAQSNPAKFVRSIVDGTFSAKEARTAIDVIKSHDPKVFESLQFHFVDHLLSKFQTQASGISTPRIVNELMSGTSGSARTPTAEMAESVLGTEKLNTLRQMMGAFAELDRQGNVFTPSNPIVDVMARTGGGLVGASGAIPGMGTGGAAYQANWMIRNGQAIRHWFGSYLLTTPELRKLALTPIDRIPPETADRMMKGFSTFVLSQVPDSSEEARQAKALAKRVER
tara:strand:+ start:20 stop:2617 length:2598 start_codon:yes stop_codon:yes gene_type:complete